ncbi:MAG: hypothetical protein AUH43_02955 [Acidobacteria bacterium 13_1_40CM_65_14]|nr:MAG: hypothetical protein AUH43_02955 [Acidobacteria bacterium 13_1_40CM_65_14]
MRAERGGKPGRPARWNAAFAAHAAEHFVLHLDDVVGIEERALAEERIGHILGARVQRPLRFQRVALARRTRSASGHPTSATGNPRNMSI